MKQLLIALTLVLPSLAFAGVGSAVIKCRTPDNKFKLSAYAGDSGDASADLEVLNADGKTYTKVSYMNAINAANLKLNNEAVPAGTNINPIVVVDDENVFALIVVKSGSGDFDSEPLRLQSVAKTFKVSKGKYDLKHITFQASLTGDDPHTTNTYLSANLYCAYDYSL